jgi:hypothetical protein
MPQDTSKLEQEPRKAKRVWGTPRLTEHGSLKQITTITPKTAGTPDGNGSFIGG